MQRTQRKAFRTAALVALLLIIPFHLAAIFLFGMPLWKALIVDVCYLSVVIIPIYAAITKGEKAHAQPSKKYMVKYIWFPIGFVVSFVSLLSIQAPAIVLVIFFFGAFVAVNVYFYFA